MSASLAIPNTEASILSRVLERRVEDLTPAAAEFLLAIQFPTEDVNRMNTLSNLAQLGALSPDQQLELDSYVHVGNLLALMQSRARKLLRVSDPV